MICPYVVPSPRSLHVCELTLAETVTRAADSRARHSQEVRGDLEAAMAQTLGTRSTEERARKEAREVHGSRRREGDGDLRIPDVHIR